MYDGGARVCMRRTLDPRMFGASTVGHKDAGGAKERRKKQSSGQPTTLLAVSRQRLQKVVYFVFAHKNSPSQQLTLVA